MKRILEQNFYELLDIHPHANRDEIRRAYRTMKDSFHEDSLAIYSLYDSNELARIQDRLDEAYRILMDEKARADYDLTLQPLPMGSPGKDEDREVQTHLESFQDEAPSSPQNGGRVEDPELDLFLNNIVDNYSGELLKRFRESKGISLEWVARETRISITYLQFIETNHFGGLPHWVYLKSYLYQYAEFLGINPQQVVEGFLKHYPHSP